MDQEWTTYKEVQKENKRLHIEQLQKADAVKKQKEIERRRKEGPQKAPLDDDDDDKDDDKYKNIKYEYNYLDIKNPEYYSAYRPETMQLPVMHKTFIDKHEYYPFLDYAAVEEECNDILKVINNIKLKTKIVQLVQKDIDVIPRTHGIDWEATDFCMNELDKFDGDRGILYIYINYINNYNNNNNNNNNYNNNYYIAEHDVTCRNWKLIKIVNEIYAPAKYAEKTYINQNYRQILKDAAWEDKPHTLQWARRERLKYESFYYHEKKLEAFDKYRSRKYPDGVLQWDYFVNNDRTENCMKGIDFKPCALYEDPWVHNLALEVQDRSEYERWMAHDDVYNWKDPEWKFFYEWYKQNRTLKRAWYLGIETNNTKNIDSRFPTASLKDTYDKGCKFFFRAKMDITCNWANLFQNQVRFCTLRIVTTPPINIG